MSVLFSNLENETEWQSLHPKVKRLATALAAKLLHYDADAIVTSCIRPLGQIPGESGVHATGRAADLVPKFRAVATKERQLEVIAEELNLEFPRKDGKKSVVYHKDSDGCGCHFHLQVPWSADYQDLQGHIPKP
jgi:hypothetical protein